jgi:hypothetical protein
MTTYSMSPYLAKHYFEMLNNHTIEELMIKKKSSAINKKAVFDADGTWPEKCSSMIIDIAIDCVIVHKSYVKTNPGDAIKYLTHEIDYILNMEV